MFYRDKQKSSNATPLVENLVGFKVHFYRYGELVNLVEEIFVYQVYDFKSNTDAPIIIDGGSNIGISILYFKLIYPSSQVIAFEPHKESFELLTQNVFNNHLSSVTLFNLALSDKEGEAEIFGNNHHPESLTMTLHNAQDKQIKEIVNTTMISAYIQDEIDLIKLDVEGSEIEIIHELIISQKIHQVKKMIIEYHPMITSINAEQFVQTLSNYNFLCELMVDHLHPGSTDWMIRCVR